MGRFVLGATGASGVVLVKRTIIALSNLGHEIDLVMTPHALYTASLEMGKEFSKVSAFLRFGEKVRLHPIQDVGAAIASGSYPTDGMIILPCSMATLAAISIGLADNSLRRAADVTLKEKRPLIIVPREAPLSTLHIENLLKISRLGATIVPPVPAWYIDAKTIEEMEDFIVGKILDCLKLEHHLYKRWKTESSSYTQTT